MNAMCYKTKEPTYYNKGTSYETSCDTFLSYYASNNKAEAEAEAEYYNREKPEKDTRGYPIDWSKIDYFYINEQDLFDD